MITFFTSLLSRIQKRARANADGHGTKGFTLIELLVVIAIFTILTATLLLVRPSSDNQTELNNVAREMVLFMREAQAYGSGVRNPGVLTFRAVYGVHIAQRDPTHLVLFAMSEGIGYQYSSAPSSKKSHIDEFELPPGFTISDFCVSDGASSRCTGSGGGSLAACPSPAPPVGVSSAPIGEMDIIFERPSLDSLIFAHGPGPSCQRGSTGSIELTYKGNSITIEISETGVMQVVAP